MNFYTDYYTTNRRVCQCKFCTVIRPPSVFPRAITRPDCVTIQPSAVISMVKQPPAIRMSDSFICGKSEYISSSGTVGMAKGGSGDVLTGIVGSLLAQGYSPTDAAWMASEIHGLAGEAAARRLGTIAMTPMDTVDSLSEVFMAYAP